MKRYLFTLVGILMLAGVAHADTAVVNDPRGAEQDLKAAWNLLNPSADWLYDIKGEVWHNGTSIKVVQAPDKWKWHLNALQGRIGWAETQIGFGEIALDAEKLTGIKLAKYAHAGFAVGHDFSSSGKRLAWGPVVGVKADF